MNFVAIIGIVDDCKKINDYTTELLIKTEKPNYTNEEDWYEKLSVLVSNEKFKQELESINNGTIIGIKGRLSLVNKQNRIISEKVHLF